ncbi:S-adenosyl-L-methionine-dependent methyltransferase [Mycena amicta]|nr:S-adenosyl-L-methionine-dependent methyltransferase [Mycena amicta]
MSSLAPDDVPYLHFPTAGGSPSEENRLDGFHSALVRYLGGKPYLAPLEDIAPRRVLELGSGSGAWANDIAVRFPDAEVVAVDAAEPQGTRIFAPNVTFQKIDLTKEWPFEDGQYDVVHARLLLMHIPQGAEIARRAARLVKPGGYLLMEEFDFGILVGTGEPEVAKMISTMIDFWAERSADMEIGHKLEGIVRDTGNFADVETRRICMPFGGSTTDESLNDLGLAMRKSWLQLIDSLSDSASFQARDGRFTKAMFDENSHDLESEECKAGSVDIYLCWARRVSDEGVSHA